MSGVDTFRYVVALSLLCLLPGAYTYWLVVHPFVGTWRRVGPGPALVVAYAQYLGMALLLFRWRHRLLVGDLGTNLVTIALGSACLIVASVLRRQWRRHLSLRVLHGLPELASGGQGSRLLTEGIYARVRHPRYLEILVAVLGWALVTNYLTSYILVAYSVIMTAVLIPLEERELVGRFGQAYEEYRARVPALLPKLGGR